MSIEIQLIDQLNQYLFHCKNGIIRWISGIEYNHYSIRKFLAKIDKGIQLYYKNVTLDNETINSSKKAILNIIEKINNKFEAEKSQLSELIKRSIIGVLLISFFVAILRYFRNLYQFHLNEMLKDESKEIEIRKFYIAMKCAESNPEERKLVLATSNI